MSSGTEGMARTGKVTGVDYQYPAAFRFGAAAVSVGILLQLPFFFGAKETHYQLHGRPVDGYMLFGNLLVILGVAAVAYGLFPRLSEVSRGYVSKIRVRAMDEAPIKPAHIGLLLVMAAAVTIDVMKPTAWRSSLPASPRSTG
jgi:putative MFS transporter